MLEKLLELNQKKELIGRFIDLDERDYRNGPGISRSDLLLINRSYRHYLQSKTINKETPALYFGKAFHMALLEPDKFDDTYINEKDFLSEEAYIKEFTKDIKRRTKAGKEEYVEKLPRLKESYKLYAKDFIGKIAMKPEVREIIEQMTEKIRQHPLVKQFFKNSELESSYYGYDPIYGFLRKSRLDLITDTEIIDFKTTLDASLNRFSRDIVNYMLHFQAAYYLDVARLAGFRFKRFMFVCVEKEPPYEVAIYDLNSSAIEVGHEIMERLLCKMNKYLNNKTKGYPRHIQTIGLPAFGYSVNDFVND